MFEWMKKPLRKDEKVVYIYRKVKFGILNVIWYPYICFYRKKKCNYRNIVFCECYVKFHFYRIKKNNWGDDINKFFFELVTGNKFIFIPYSRLSIKNKDIHYSLIGSIIGFYDLDNTIIYGSGIGRPDVKIQGVPKKIFSVRGPLTREVMIKNNINCPEKYGDPALLLPLFYSPRVSLNNQICVIPNMGTNIRENFAIETLVKRYGCKCLDMRHYDKWTDVIDEIRKCSFVISESLHGLIVAETYGIPNVWVEFVKHHKYWDFKFRDYYESIGKEGEESKKLYSNLDWNVLVDAKNEWVKGKIDYQEMLTFFPFEIPS